MKGNAPQSEIEELAPQFVSETVSCLKELNSMGKPESDEELQERIDQYFAFCERTGNRPGVETLCLALHITRTTLFRWGAGIDCSVQRREIISNAKQFIAGFLEQSVLRGKISPPSGIFMLKNWLNYKDTLSFENTVESYEHNYKPTETAQQIIDKYKSYAQIELSDNEED